MKVSTKSARPMRSAGWEFFFQLVHVSPIATAVFLIFWLLERLLLLAPSIMLIFHDTEWERVSEVARYFSPVTYFSSAYSFSIFCYSLFALVQLGILLALLKFFLIKHNLDKERLGVEYSLLSKAVHFFLVIATKILLQVCASLLFYVIYSFWDDYGFSGFKHISPNLISGSASRYALTALLTFAFLELIVLTLGHAFFCQDRSVRNTLPWSANTFYAEILLLCLKIAVQGNFILIRDTNDLICFILLILWLCNLGVIVWYVKWENLCVDVAEFFYAALMLMIVGFELSGNVLGVIDLAKHCHYLLILPLFALKFALIRYVVMSGASAERPKKDNEAIELVKFMIGLAKCSDRAASMKLLMLLCSHARDCARTDCECRLLKTRANRDRGLTLQESTRIYITNRDMPERYNDGYLIKSLKLLISELEQIYNKSDAFCITVAEVYFYYLGNHYYSWDQLHTISLRKPSMFISQRMYNLRRSISIGLEAGSDIEADPERTCASIDYLKHYHRFLEQAEDSTDLTIKFWSVLLKEAPSSQELNDIGKKLFESKYNIMKTTERLSRITSNHIEFLVRYGVFMKYVMHDFVSSDEVYKKILYLGECSKNSFLTACHFSLFRTDARVLFLVASLDNARNMLVRQVNTEFENTLGYTRKDIIGYSVTNIMPPIIARRHEEYVQRFFQTMQAKNLGQNNRSLRFIKNKDGEYIPCGTLKKIVPRLNDGLEVAVFMIPENRMRKYTRFCREKSCTRFGAIICDKSYRIVGFTKKAVEMLRITGRIASELSKNSALQDVFPAFENRALVSELGANEGRVVAYSSAYVQVDTEKCEEPVPIVPKTITMPLSIENISTKALITSTNVIASLHTLFWATIRKEEYGVENPDSAYVFVFSIIPVEELAKYVPSPACEGLFEDKSQQIILAKQVEESAAGTNSHAKTRARNLNLPDNNNDTGTIFSYSVGSVASVASVSVTTARQSEALMKTATQIRVHSVSNQTPTSIKRLVVILVFILVGIIALTVAEMIVSADEMTYLTDRFELIQVYHLRYKLDVGLASMMGVYATNLAKTKTAFDQFMMRTIGRTDTVSHYNEKTRRLMFAQNLDYEMDMLGVPDIPSGEREVSFGHSQLIFINGLVECISYGFYDQVSACAKANTNATCTRIKQLLDNGYRSLFYYTRFKQDEVSSRLETELKSLSIKGRTTRYIITGVCTGLVLASLIAVMPIFSWVIRDKSYVMAIFSDVEQEEVLKMIEECKKIDIKNVKYRKRWLQKSEWQQDDFWGKVMSDHKRRFKNALPANNSNDDFLLLSPHKLPLDKTKGPELSLFDLNLNAAAVEDPHHDHEAQTRLEKKKTLSEDLDATIKLTMEKKRQERRKNLGATDSQLRCRAFLRLILVASLCLAYAGVAFYLNYYVHDVNSEAVTMFFALNKRNIFTTLLAIFVREAQSTGNVQLIQSNTDGDGKMYMQDVVNYMSVLEKQCRYFQKYASRRIYDRYLTLLERAESDQFCAVSDSYNYSQTIPCSNYYQGPLSQGLSVAIAYVIDYYTQYGNKILNTNFSNPTAAAAIKSDTAAATFSANVASYTSPVQEFLLKMFYDDAQSFFSTAASIEYIVPTCFIVMFVGIYIGIFATFIVTLKKEIRETHGVLNMIPMFILEGNQRVKEQVINHKQIKQ